MKLSCLHGRRNNLLCSAKTKHSHSRCVFLERKEREHGPIERHLIACRNTGFDPQTLQEIPKPS